MGTWESTSILGDPCLPTDVNMYVSTMGTMLENRKVSNLFRMDVKEWDEDLVRDVFNDKDANIILGIPLTRSSGLNDSWYWGKEVNRVYSVKSAYRWIQSQKNVNNEDDNLGFWKNLWQLKFPPKVKDLIWRATTICLPTKMNLRRKHVLVNSACPFYDILNETTFHCLVACDFSWQ